MDNEKQHEENRGYSLPSRSTIHKVKEERDIDKKRWGLPIILGSVIFIIIISTVVGMQLSDRDKDANLADNQNQQVEELNTPSDTGYQEVEENTIKESESTAVEEEIEQQDNTTSDGEHAQLEIIHKVKQGENLYRISLQYYDSGDYVKALAAYNGLKNANEIYAGLQLKIPDKALLSH